MRCRGYEVPGRGVTRVHQPGQAVVIALRTQRRQAGHAHTGPLRRLPQRTLPAGMVLPVTVVMVPRRIVGRRAHGHRRRGDRNLFAVRDGLETNAGHRSAFVGSDMTHRGIGADSVRIQQTEEEQAQAQHAPQNRCRAAPLHTGGRPGRNHAVILTRLRSPLRCEGQEHCVNKPSAPESATPVRPTTGTGKELRQLQTVGTTPRGEDATGGGPAGGAPRPPRDWGAGPHAPPGGPPPAPPPGGGGAGGGPPAPPTVSWSCVSSCRPSCPSARSRRSGP